MSEKMSKIAALREIVSKLSEDNNVPEQDILTSLYKNVLLRFREREEGDNKVFVGGPFDIKAVRKGIYDNTRRKHGSVVDNWVNGPRFESIPLTKRKNAFITFVVKGNFTDLEGRQLRDDPEIFLLYNLFLLLDDKGPAGTVIAECSKEKGELLLKLKPSDMIELRSKANSAGINKARNG